MSFGMFGNFAGGLVQGAGMGLKIMDQADQLDERQREQQLAKDSAAAFSKIGKDDHQGFVDNGGQIKVGNQQFNDMATAKKFASDKDLASFVTDGASNPANSAQPTAPSSPSAPSTSSGATTRFPDQDTSGVDTTPAPTSAPQDLATKPTPASSGAIPTVDASQPDQSPASAQAPTDPSSITQSKLATPLPVQTLDKSGNAVPMKTYGMQDYLNYKAQRAGELGLGKQADEAMAKALASRFSNAAMKAYAAGDYDEVYRLHNVLPDGYTVKRQVIPANQDGAGGGILLTMVNDKTGEVWGQPIKFANDREAAGAFVAAAQQKLPEWLIQQGRQDNDTTRALYKMQVEQQKISQRYSAMESNLLGKIAGLSMKGAGAGGGKGDLAYGADPQMSFVENLVKNGKGDDGQPLGLTAQTNIMANAEQIHHNHPNLSPAAIAQISTDATLHPESIKPEFDPKSNSLMLVYRDPTAVNKDGDNVGTPYIVSKSITPELAKQRGFSDKMMAQAASVAMSNMSDDQKSGLKLVTSDPDAMKQAQASIMDRYKQMAAQQAQQNPAQAQAIQQQAMVRAQSDIDALNRNAQWYRVYQQTQPAAPTTAQLKQPGGMGQAASHPAAKPQYSQDQLDVASRYGVQPPGKPLLDTVKDGLSDASSAISSYVGKLQGNTFSAYLRAFRNGEGASAAGYIAKMARSNPQYLNQLTPDDRTAIQVATGISL